MYLKLFRATEKAINELITAQQECEEMYMGAEEVLLPVEEEKTRSNASSI